MDVGCVRGCWRVSAIIILSIFVLRNRPCFNLLMHLLSRLKIAGDLVMTQDHQAAAIDSTTYIRCTM